MLNDDASNRAANMDSYRERITNFSNEFDLGLFIYIVKRSLIWIATCLLLAFSAAFLYLRYTAPTYASNATLQLGQSNNAQTVLKMSDMTEDNSLQADVQLLRSKFFIAKAVELLPLRVRYFFRGQILTEEYYKQSFFRVNDLKVTDAGIYEKPITIRLLDDGSLELSYSIANTVKATTTDLGRRFSTPEFSGTINTVGGGKWPSDPERGTLFFTINNTSSLVNQFAGSLSVDIADPSAKTINIIRRHGQ